MNISHRKTILSAVVAALGALAAGQAMAQEFPSLVNLD